MWEWMRRHYRLFLARTHLSGTAVCEASKGPRDYHRCRDSQEKALGHKLVCVRCHKEFEI